MVGRPAQAVQAPYRAPRTADGRPDLNGIWQALGTAHWDIDGHAARPGPVVALGALGAIPAGLGVVDVVERFAAMSPDALWYEAEIEDPNVFARP